MSDTQIIDLDEPDAAEAAVQGRAGSLSIVLTPLIAVALIIALLSAWHAATPRAEQVRSSNALAPIEGPDIVTFTPPAVLGETGDPEVLPDQRWTAIGPGFEPRGDVAEAVLDGLAYVIGGTGPAEDGRHVYRYDPRTGERERVADLPVSLDHAMAATVNGRVYVFGGFAFGRPSARVFSLGANDATWNEHTAMPAPRAAGGAAAIADRVYIVGGVGADGVWIRETWAYDSSGRWVSALAPIPTQRDHLAVASYRDRVCAAGGDGGQRAFECYDPARNAWTVMPELRRSAIGARAVELAGWLWVVTTNVQVFTIDHWHFAPPPQTWRAGHALVAIDGALYVIEGGLGFTSQRMEMLRPQP